MLRRYSQRGSRLHRLLKPPLPLVHNPGEPAFAPGPGPSLLVGAAGSGGREGFIGMDLFAGAGVHLRADLESLPFAADSISAIECDAVLEHVRDASRAVTEMRRVLRPGGRLHVVVPFNHPFHEYPADYRRWTLDGLRELLAGFDVEACGVRTGPTATLLTFLLEYVKVVAPPGLGRAAYAAAGWLVWPLRYLDLWIYRRPASHVLANSIYAFARKRAADGSG
jgi:SAM-dependent methyltransferase